MAATYLSWEAWLWAGAGLAPPIMPPMSPVPSMAGLRCEKIRP